MRYIVFVLFALVSWNVSAQQDSVKTTKKKKELTAEQLAKRAAMEKKFSKLSKDRFAIDFMGSNWIYSKNDPRIVDANGVPNNLSPKWYSRGMNIAFYYDFRIKKSRFSVAPGIGYSSSNIYSRHELLEDTNGITLRALPNPNDYKVNKITLQYLEIPLEFRIKTNPDKLDQIWKFAVGFKAGVRVDAHTKVKVKEGAATKVYVERRFPDFNLFRIGPTIRIGYSSFNLTAFYSVLGVFKKDRGPGVNEFAVGISFNGL
jgi:hypothetical protein